MIYLYLYLAIGAVTLVVMYVTHRLSAKSESEGLTDILDAMNPERNKLSYRVINKGLVPVLASVIAILFWPAILYMKIKDICDRGPGGRFEEKVFQVSKADLLAKRTIQQIESDEVIEDPLDAVPALPFGHLNKCWKNLLAQMMDGDEIWSFRSKWDGNWGRTELRSGYVLVREGSPEAFILTARIPVEKDDGG